MKTFSEQLDKFVERGAEQIGNKILYEKDCTCEYDYDNCPYNHKSYDAVFSYNVAANSLKPIVLKLVETMLKIRDNDLRRIDCKAFAEKSLAEVEQMIGEGK